MTSFPVRLARQRASVSGKRWLALGLVCAGVFSTGVPSIKAAACGGGGGGEDKEENAANPQIRFPLGYQGLEVLGLGE